MVDCCLGRAPGGGGGSLQGSFIKVHSQSLRFQPITQSAPKTLLSIPTLWELDVRDEFWNDTFRPQLVEDIGTAPK